MNDYIQVDFDFTPVNEVEVDVLDALLCDEGYESFVPNEKGVTAFIKKELYNEAGITNALSLFPFTSSITWSVETIVGQDWNEEWEKNFFKPMIIADKCVIHSSFHTDYPKLEYDVVIDPKMAFGTGHHSTTNLIVSELLSMDLKGKKILDMGTGTGILSIISVMHGAESAVGIEIDEAAYVNALENIELNNVAGRVAIFRGDATLLNEYENDNFDIVLANINRNVITGDIDKYARTLKSGGLMLLSGFYMNEATIVSDAALNVGLTPINAKEDNNWALLILQKL